jgi:hypothetical protein
MIIPVKIPAPVSLSENPVIVRLRTDNDVITQGSKAKVVLYFGQVIYTGTGYQFSLTFGGNTYTFTMAVSPDTSGLQFPRAAATDNNLTWMSKITDSLYANFYISELYNISYTYNQITITAKAAGSEYNISGNNISVAGMSINPYPATDQVERKFFKVFLQVSMDGNVIGEDIKPVDAAKIAEFDISEYLKANVQNTFSFPEISQHRMIKRAGCCKDYMLRWCEFYVENNVPAMHGLTTYNTLKAITGGLSSKTQALYNKNNTSWYSQLTMNHKFLTWHPGNKKTAVYDIQKLYYMVHTYLPGNICSDNLYLYAGLNYSLNGVNYTSVIFKEPIFAAKHDVIEICCGYSKLGLDVNAAALPSGSLVTSYDVFLKDNAGSVVSEVFNFILDTDYYEFYRQFIFRNSFGMYETVRFTGVKEINTSYENSVNDYMRMPGFTERDPDSKKFASTEKAKHVINTGYITAEELDWMRELFLSKEVYEIQDDLLYPVIITGDSALVSRDDNTLHNHQIEYEYACNEYHYSKGDVLNNANGTVVIIPINQEIGIVEVPQINIELPNINIGLNNSDTDPVIQQAEILDLID